MNEFLLNRVRSLVGSSNVVNVDFKSASLPSDLNKNQIDFNNTRGSVRLVNKNVLTPSEKNKMVDDILEFDFEH